MSSTSTISYESDLAHLVQENNTLQLLLHLADNAFIMGHRCSEWCGHGPILEQDIAITNIALDYIGSARNFYQYAAILLNEQKGAELITEDTLAYLRDSWDFKNCLLVELPNGDWSQTTLRLFLFSAYQHGLYQLLKEKATGQLAAIAEKSLKEVSYHLRWSSEWVVRLGDGTEESKSRIQKSLMYLWPYTGELFEPAPYENAQEVNIDYAFLQKQWYQKISDVLQEATLTLPNEKPYQTGGKNGIHTEHLGYILAEMQFLQRAYPGATW